MAQQPLDPKVLEALLQAGDAAFEIRQRAFNISNGTGDAKEHFDAIDEQVAYLTQLLPLIKYKMEAQTERPEEQHEAENIQVTITQLTTTTILVPIVKTRARDRGWEKSVRQA